ncbi:isoamylase early set domain-containing protein [Planosporangium sp. 12N6]|uniref:isoamylase early set domain-containing protein n=1 Tax=Planosporangium spinosum TaxID=3402278 RepID=UPI003CF92B44
MIKRSRLFGTKTRVTFTLPADEPAGDVSVVGTFNDWTPGIHRLLPRRGGTRSVSVTLPPGEHRFRYLGTGGVWFDDETADRVEENACVLQL